LQVWRAALIVGALAIGPVFPSSATGAPAAETAGSTPAAADDASETVVRRAVAAALTNDRRELGELYQSVAQAEGDRSSAKDLRLSDAIRYLFITSSPNRDTFLVAGEEGVREIRHEELRLRLVQALLDDDYYEMAQLKGQNSFNRFTRVFNRASSSLSKLALFQPQDAVQMLVDAAYSMRKARSTSERERRIIFLSRRFLEQYPDAPERSEVEELQRQLLEKFRRERVEQEILAGRAALDTDDFRAAIFHFESAALLDTSSTRAQDLLAQARHAQQQAEEQCYESVAVSDWEAHLSPVEAQQLERAARALAVGDGAALVGLKDTAPALTDSVAYAQAALAEQRGRHDDALALLQSLAAAGTATPGARAASALLATPSYNLDSAFDDAVARLEEERKKFIVTGKRNTDDAAYALGSAAVQNVTYVPALFVTDMMVRGVTEYFRTQLAIDSVVDAGAAYIRRYPGSPRSGQIAKQIAGLASKSGDPARTRAYLELAGDEDPARLAKVRENEARKLYASASEATDLVERKRFLEQIVADYGETKMARTAQKELDKLQPTLEAGSIVLTRKMLAEDKELVAALGIAPELVDGSKRNGELAEEGVALTADTSRYSFKLVGSDSFETRTIPRDRRSWLRARAIALQSTFIFKTTGKEAIHQRVLPLEVEGGAGSGGVEVAPKILPYPEPKKDSQLFR
jgi:hypothetical protein